jgi:hypothetical protein
LYPKKGTLNFTNLLSQMIFQPKLPIFKYSGEFYVIGWN